MTMTYAQEAYASNMRSSLQFQCHALTLDRLPFKAVWLCMGLTYSPSTKFVYFAR